MAGSDSVLRYVSVDVSSRPCRQRYSIFSSKVSSCLPWGPHQSDSYNFSYKWILPIVEGYLMWVFSTNIIFSVVLPFCCKLTVGSCAILVQWFWKCLLWEAETNFHQNFSFFFWSEIHQSLVVVNISVAYIWEASLWRRALMVLSVLQKHV